jgi:hypothetical protein
MKDRRRKPAKPSPADIKARASSKRWKMTTGCGHQIIVHGTAAWAHTMRDRFNRSDKLGRVVRIVEVAEIP